MHFHPRYSILAYSFSATSILSGLLYYTKTNLYFEISSPTALSEHALYMLLIFHVPHLMSIFFPLGRLSKESVQVRGLFWMFVTSLFFYSEMLAPLPTSKLEDHPLSAVRDCFFNIFAAALHKWRASPPSATWGRTLPWWVVSPTPKPKLEDHPLSVVRDCLFNIFAAALH
jgi:hypothetical protein